MSSIESVAGLIKEIRAGNRQAAEQVWDAYFPDLLRIARLHLRCDPRRTADEEDVALSALKSFFQAAKKGRFPDLTDREGLWRLLSRMTQRKAVTLIRRNLRQTSGGGKVRGESALGTREPPGAECLADLAVDELTPEMAAIVAENCRRLLDSLGDTALQAIAIDKMSGYTNAEIAEKHGVALRTIERRLKLIRAIWKRVESSE
jgi:DNA-directed RNA polymerase specialized sigma24 family protein